MAIVIIGCAGLYLQNRKGAIDDFPDELDIRMQQYDWGLALEGYSALAAVIYFIMMTIYGIQRFVRKKHG